MIISPPVRAQDTEWDHWNEGDAASGKLILVTFKVSALTELSGKGSAISIGMSGCKNVEDDTYLGVGLNMEKYSNATFMPIYLELRSISYDEPEVRPYLFINVGYALGFVRSSSGGGHGGPLAALGFGVGMTMTEETIFTLETAFKYQKIESGDRQELFVGFTIGRFRADSE